MAKLRQETGFQPGVYRGIPFTKERFQRFVEGSNQAIKAGIPIPLLKRHAPINASDSETQAFAAQDAEGAGWITQFFVTPQGNLGWEADNVPDHVVSAVKAGTIKFTSPEFREGYSSEKQGAYSGPIIRHMAFTPLPGNPHQSPVDVIALQELNCFQFTEADYEGPISTQYSEKSTRPTGNFEDTWNHIGNGGYSHDATVEDRHGHEYDASLYAANIFNQYHSNSSGAMAKLTGSLIDTIKKTHPNSAAHDFAFRTSKSGYAKADDNDTTFARNVFKVVKPAFRHLLDHKDEQGNHKNRLLTFSADADEKSRVKLYHSLSDKAAKYHPYTGYALGGSKTSMVKYVLVHNDHAKDFEKHLRDNSSMLKSRNYHSVVKHTGNGNPVRYKINEIGRPKRRKPNQSMPNQKALDLQYSELSTRPKEGDYDDQWSGHKHGQLTSEFKDGDDTFTVSAGARRLHPEMPHNKQGYYLDFMSKENGFSQPIDPESPHAISTFGKISHRIRTLIDKHSPTHLHFSATNHEPTRVELYKTLSRQLTKYHPNYIARAYPSVGDHEFDIVHKDHMHDYLTGMQGRSYSRQMLLGPHAHYENGKKSLHNGMEAIEQKLQERKKLMQQHRIMKKKMGASAGNTVHAPTTFNSEYPDL